MLFESYRLCKTRHGHMHKRNGQLGICLKNTDTNNSLVVTHKSYATPSCAICFGGNKICDMSSLDQEHCIMCSCDVQFIVFRFLRYVASSFMGTCTHMYTKQSSLLCTY